MRLQLSEPAKEDLVEIWEYVAEENPDAARRLLEMIRTKFEMLCTFPMSGRERNELIMRIKGRNRSCRINNLQTILIQKA